MARLVFLPSGYGVAVGSMAGVKMGVRRHCETSAEDFAGGEGIGDNMRVEGVEIRAISGHI